MKLNLEKVFIKNFDILTYSSLDATNREITAMLKQNIAKLEKGYARIRQGKAQNKRIKEWYYDIAETFKDSFTPLQDYSSVINQAFTMKNNVGQLNKSLKQFVNLGEEVNTLVEELDDSQKILDVYKRLVILIKLKRSLIEKFKSTEFSNEDNSTMKLEKLEKEFTGIKLLEEKFYEKMHGFMKNHQFIIQKQPAYFIKIMRIIECDNRIDQITRKSHAMKSITEEVEGISSKEESKMDEKVNNSLGLKESWMEEIGETVKNQALEAYKTAFTIESIIDISERLMKSLK